MKTKQSVPTIKGRTTAKATPSAKAAPTRGKTKRVKLVALGDSTPQDQASPPAVHSAEEVALRAYHNFQKRGSADGAHTDDWLRAEAELTSERRLVRA